MSCPALSPKFLFTLFFSFFKVGCFTFGGGFAMIPVIQREVCDNKCWMEQEEFIDMIAVTQSAPGPVAVNSSVFVGYKLAGIPGAVIALFGTVLPSFIIILLFAVFIASQSGTQYMTKFFEGVRPAVVALILGAGLGMGKKSIKDSFSIIIGVLAISGLILLKIHPIVLIIFGAIAGILRSIILSKGNREVS